MNKDIQDSVLSREKMTEEKDKEKENFEQLLKDLKDKKNEQFLQIKQERE